MKRICAAGLAAVIGAAQLSSALPAADPVAERFWPQWRGRMRVASPEAPIPPLNGARRTIFDGRLKSLLQRLNGLPEVYSSPVAAQGRVYITSRDGTTLVIRHGSRFEVLATNALDDGFDASPALVDKELYLRGNRYLYCIAEP